MNDVERKSRGYKGSLFLQLSPELHVCLSSSFLGLPSCTITGCFELVMLESPLHTLPDVCFSPTLRLRDPMGSCQIEVGNFGVLSFSHFPSFPSFIADQELCP